MICFADDKLDCILQPNFHQSLRSEGRSLHNMPVQNQGNIGSCYANSLSLSLFSIVDYEVSSNFLALKNHQDEKGRSITDGGNSCELYDKIKNEFLCSPKEIPLDRQTDGGIDVIFENLGAFFDDFSPGNNNSEQDMKYLNEIAEMEKIFGSNAEYICDSIFQKPLAFLNDQHFENINSIAQLLKDAPGDIESFTLLGYPLEPNIDEFYPKNKNTKKRAPSSKMKDLMGKFFQTLNTEIIPIEDEEIRLEAYRDLVLGLYEAIGARPGNVMFTVLDQLFPNMNANFPENEYFLYQFESDLRVADYNICVNKKIMNYLEKDAFNQIFKGMEVDNETSTCRDTQLGNVYLGMIESLKIINGSVLNIADSINDLQSFLKISPTLDEFISNYIISGDCKNDRSINAKQKLSNFSCRKYPLVKRDDLGKSLAEQKTILRTRLDNIVQKQMRKDRPIMIDVCTGFFLDPSNTIDLDPDNCGLKDQTHGLHSMAIIGQRCNNGSLEYQIQNSWGKDCNYLVPLTAEGYLSDSPPIYDCEKESGSFWVNEYTLINNIFSIQALSN